MFNTNYIEFVLIISILNTTHMSSLFRIILMATSVLLPFDSSRARTTLENTP